MTIHVVGLGLDPANLPEDSASVIDHAQVLAGGKRLLEIFDDHPAEKLALASPLNETIDALAERAQEGRMTVVLADGDPLFFGIGATLVDRLGPDEVRIYPNVTTLQVAAARLRIPWHQVRTVSLHGRDDYGPLMTALRFSDWVAVFTDPSNVPSAIAQAILDKGGERFAMWVLEDLETDQERFGRYTLAEAGRKSFSKMNLVLLERRPGPAPLPALGAEDEEFAHQKNLITKRPVRAAALAALRLGRDSTLWDLGAGCGAVAVEAASLTGGRVLAVERNADRVACIRENVLRFGAYTVDAVHGTMPDCLDDLPDPDRIFMGGGLGRDDAALRRACERLRPGGRIAINVILMESLNRARTLFHELDWPYTITLVQAAQSSPMAGDLRLEGLNPVFIVAADKPAE